MRRAFSNALWPAALVTSFFPLLAGAGLVARLDRLLLPNSPFSAWPLTPGITLGIVLAGCLYINGEGGRAAANGDHLALRHLSFFCGLAALFLALQSPLEPISDHLFMAHQVEHMLLRTGAPMLLVLSLPQAALLRGLPHWVRRQVVAPLLRSPAAHSFGILSHPAMATVLFIGTTYFWMIPRFHNLALLDERVHELWHTTLLLSGLVFFWRILDLRPYPLGASLCTRLFMFWLASIGNILLGSYLSLKHGVLYDAYDVAGRLWAIAPATDENIGGLIMWIPGSMMFAATAMLMIYRWARQEERIVARRGVAERTTAAQFRLQHRSANRRMAIGLICFAATVVAITFTTAIIYHDAGGERAIAAF